MMTGFTAQELEELRAKAEAAHKHNPTGVWTHGHPDTWIWATRHDGDQMHIAGVRGWGGLTGRGGGLALDDDEALATQRAWGEHIAALNPATALRLIQSAELVSELVGRLEGICDAYECLCGQAGMNYHESPTSKYAAARATLAKAKAGGA